MKQFRWAWILSCSNVWSSNSKVKLAIKRRCGCSCTMRMFCRLAVLMLTTTVNVYVCLHSPCAMIVPVSVCTAGQWTARTVWDQQALHGCIFAHVLLFRMLHQFHSLSSQSLCDLQTHILRLRHSVDQNGHRSSSWPSSGFITPSSDCVAVRTHLLNIAGVRGKQAVGGGRKRNRQTGRRRRLRQTSPREGTLCLLKRVCPATA